MLGLNKGVAYLSKRTLPFKRQYSLDALSIWSNAALIGTQRHGVDAKILDVAVHCTMTSTP